jgi:hypothetical protein
VASLAYDLLGPDHVLRKLYENDDFREFLGAVLDLEKEGGKLYRSADPLGAWCGGDNSDIPLRDT